VTGKTLERDEQVKKRCVKGNQKKKEEKEKQLK